MATVVRVGGGGRRPRRRRQAGGGGSTAGADVSGGRQAEETQRTVPDARGGRRRGQGQGHQGRRERWGVEAGLATVSPGAGSVAAGRGPEGNCGTTPAARAACERVRKTRNG